MAKKYEPYLFGTDHTIQNLEAVIHELDRLELNKVGIEPAKIHLLDSSMLHFIPSDVHMFWRGLLEYFTRRKIKVVFLTSDKLARLIHRIIREKDDIRESASGADLSRFMELSHHQYRLIHRSMLAEMEQKAKSGRPDLLLVGAAHAGVMRKDLRIPKPNCKTITHRTGSEIGKIMREEIRYVRRTQMRQKRRPLRKK